MPESWNIPVQSQCDDLVDVAIQAPVSSSDNRLVPFLCNTGSVPAKWSQDCYEALKMEYPHLTFQVIPSPSFWAGIVPSFIISEQKVIVCENPNEVAPAPLVAKSQ